MEVTEPHIIYHIERAKQGNQSAFNFLLDQYWNKVFGFQVKRIQDEQEAEDITIETFAKAFDNIQQYDSEQAAFGTWVTAISKNIQIDKTRKKNAALYRNTTKNLDDDVIGIADGAPSPEDTLITKQQLDELLRYIKELKPHYQEIINLRYFREMSYNEIAEKLQEPLSNVKVRLLRARKLLAEIIRNQQ
ncbi:sigma-70 family RNA polymerase sigma factor [Flavobacteriaceae bacterium TK19130]|nr:sigma-70 family RNA polymerase sigma factor [Thermobacterium salinum]